MNENYYEAISELRIMEFAQNYNNWIIEIIRPHIGLKIMEVGAGTGTFTHFLKDYGMVYATDRATNCVKSLQHKFGSCDNINVLQFDLMSKNDLYLSKFDSLILLNVLEHIENDNMALSNAFGLLSQGGRVIIMVPAFQFAFGSIDRFDGHFRRYSKVELKRKLGLAGFKIGQIRYFNSLGIIAWYYCNKLLREKSTSINKTTIYDRFVVPYLKRFEIIMPPQFGQSIICVGIKQ